MRIERNSHNITVAEWILDLLRGENGGPMDPVVSITKKGGELRLFGSECGISEDEIVLVRNLRASFRGGPWKEKTVEDLIGRLEKILERKVGHEQRIDEAVKDVPGDTPELKKMSEISGVSQAQGSFLEWLREEKELVLCEFMKWEDAPSAYHPTGHRLEALLAEYHGIDLEKVEKERRALLDYIREKNERDERKP